MANYYLDNDGNLVDAKKKKKNKKGKNYILQDNGSLKEYKQTTNTTKKTTSTSGSKQSDTDERTWFQKGATSDGVTGKNVMNTVLGSNLDFKENLLSGAIGIGEKIVDTGAYLTGVLSFNDNYKKKVDKFIKKDLYDEEKIAKKIIQGDSSHMLTFEMLTDKTVDEASVFGEKTDSLLQSAGQLGATAGLQMVGVPWFVTTGATTFGGEVENALNQGATYGEAGGSALISSGAEILSEKLSGGISFGGKTLDDVLLKPLTEKISSKTLKLLTTIGIDAVGEGTEEIVSSVFSNLGTKLYKEESIGELLASEEAMDEYLESFIGGAFLGGTSSVAKVGIGAVETEAKNKLTENEQKVVEKETENRIEEREKDGNKLTEKEKKAVKEQVIKDLEKGYISTDTIESVLGGETYSQYKSAVEQEDSLQKEYKELNQMKQSEMTGEQLDRRSELKQQLEELKTNSNKTQLKDKLSFEVQSISRFDRLSESYNEKSRRSQKYEADLTMYDEKQQAVIKKAQESGILNNTNRTHEFVDMVAKISADKGVLFDFTNNTKLKESGFAVEGKTINGLVKDGNISLNIDSAKALNTIVGHEITHILEGTDLHKELVQIAKDYAITKGEYQTRFEAISKLYKDVDGAVVENEITADIVGEYLFTDSNFIHNLSTKQPNIFRKIYDEIKYLYKVATAGSKEARQLEKVKKAFDKAYRDSGKNVSDAKAENEDVNGDAETKYSLVSDENTIDFLENQEYIVTYKSMQLIDGKLYPPMSAQDKGADGKKTLRPSSVLGKWQQADENPSGIKKFAKGGYGMFTLHKGNGKSIDASYNPYEHSSNLVLNDQFEEAYQRPNLVTVECHIPVSEMTSGYKAEYAKDATGMHDWKAGVVANKIKDNKRKVYLTRWLKPVRVLDDSEVAVKYKEILGEDISVPFNVVSPSLLSELEKVGVAIDYEGSPMYKAIQKRKQAKETAKFSLSYDTEGKQLSKEQKEYFKDSKVVDENGNLKVMYHGTEKGGFHEFMQGFSDDERSFFFTDNNETAKSYSGTHENYTAQTLKTADDFNNFFAEINADDYEVREENGKFVLYEDGDDVATSDTADGIYEEFRDWTGLGYGSANYKVYLNLTNPLIVDAKRNNWDEVSSEFSQELYDKYQTLTAEEKETLTSLAEWEDMSVFRDEINNAVKNAERGTAEDYTKNLASAYKKLGGEEVNMYRLFNIAMDNFSEESVRENALQYLTTRDYSKRAKEQGYDGVIFNNIVDNGLYASGIERFTPSTVAIAFDSNQIKSVANENPTSDADIRYSLSEDGKMVDSNGNEVRLETSEAGTHGTLMAIRNINEGELRGMLEIGGIPVPSIAITDPTKVDHTNFGTISVLFDKQTIDPANKKNEVYDRDIWSSRFPRLEYEINDKKASELYTRARNVGSVPMFNPTTFEPSNLENALDRKGGESGLVEEYKNDYKMKNFYLAVTSEPVDVVISEKTRKTPVVEAEQYSFMLERMPDEIAELKTMKGREWFNKYGEKIKAVEKEYWKKEIPDFTEEDLNSIVERKALETLNLARRVYEFSKTGGVVTEKFEDYNATYKEIDNKVVQSEYEAWLRDLFSGLEKSVGIPNGKDPFTPSGRRKSFKQLHDPYTLENLVKNMTKGRTQGGENALFGVSAGAISANMATRYKSISDIKKDEWRIDAKADEKVQPLKDKLSESIGVLREYYKGSSFNAFESSTEAVFEFSAKRLTESNFRKILNDYSFDVDSIPSETLQEIISDLNALKNIPTDYFESKPQRAVGLDEVQAVVIPNTTDAKLKKELTAKGFNVIEYDPNIEGDRQNKINEFDELKFSLSNQDIAPVGDYHVYGKDIALEEAPVKETVPETVPETVQEPVQEEIAPVRKDVEVERLTFPSMREVEALERDEQQNNIESLTEDDMIDEFDWFADENDTENVKSPFDDRDIKDVGNKKTKAYMYENPEVKPYFQEEAQYMLYELRNSIKGERNFNDQLYYDTNGEQGWFATKRETSDEIAYLLDNFKYTYADLEKGLNAIIEDNGKENNAISKRIEFLLDERLREGHEDFMTGEHIPANQDYINLLSEKQIHEYSDEAYNQWVQTLADVEPLEASESFRGIQEDIAPIKEPEKKMSVSEDLTEETDEEEFGKIARILDEEPKTVSQRNKRKWAIFKANVFDKGAVFEDLSLKRKNRELMGKWNYTLYSEARAQRLIGNGNAESNVKSLNDIRAEVENSGLAKQFYEYIYHKHNVDRMNLELRYEKTKNKPVFGYDVTAEMSQEIVDQYEFAEPRFMDYAKDIYDYMNYLRQQLVDNGVISQETADLWSEMYPHYVPIRRVGDTGLNINVPLDTGRTGINAPIKRATGGNKDILPLFDTMASRTLQTYRATAKNSFGVELKNTLGTVIKNSATSVDEVIDSIDTPENLLQEAKNGRRPTFTVFENGQKVTYEITEDMYDALKPLSNSSFLTKTITALNVPSKIHRGLLTEYNPVFLFTNAIKDTQDILINSQHTARTYLKIPEAHLQIIKKGYWYNEYMENGGEQNSYFDNETNTFKTKNKGLKKILDTKLFKFVSFANNYIEMIPRLAEYIASREAGRSIEVSMLDSARVTTNFKAGGDLTKFLNRNGASFLNASVQGALQQVRNVREAKANGLKGWANLATKFAVAGLPAILLNNLMWDDDEEYEELSDYVKQNYYVVWKTDEGKFIRIPKGRTVAIIQEAIRQVSNATTGNDEADLNTFLELVVSNLAPNNPIEDNILAPIIQVRNNETWYGEDLVPSRLQDLPAEEQFDESTDAFSKYLGEKIGYSPVKINYLLDQYTGGLGDVVLPMYTPEAESGDDTTTGKMLAPFKSKFTTDSVMNNQYVSDFYKKADELTTNAKKSNATDEDVLKNKYFGVVKDELSELYAEKREIQNSNLSNSVKYSQVRAIQEKINAITENALNTYEGVSIDGNYATVGEIHYRLTDENEWQKLTDKQLEKQEEVTNGLGISASEYWSNKSEYDYAYENPSKYAVAKSVGGYESYKTYSSELYDIKADKDSNGKSISGSRKEKVINYVNGLDIDYGSRLILFKNEYNADDTYNEEIIDYLNSREDISYSEMVSILEELGFKVDSDGTIRW